MSKLTSVRRARHDARRQTLATINAALADTNQVLSDVFATLEGRPGLTVEEQEQNLRLAAERIADLPAALSKATSSDVGQSLAKIIEGLNDAAGYAADRDFDAHQQAKAAAGEGALPALDGEGFVTPDEIVGDFMAASLSASMDDEQ
jgi:hypothetical protein